MPQLRIALAQANPILGDLVGNAEVVLDRVRRAHESGAHIVAFPEMFLTGYPVEDLALRRSFLDASRAAVEKLAGRLAEQGLGHILVLVGYLDGLVDDAPRVGRPAGSPQNAAAFLHEGAVVARYAKHHLPNYGVFDEARYFVPGSSLSVVRLHGVDVAAVICEDLWQDGGPVAVTREAGAGLLVVINASPYEQNKDDARLELVRRRASEAGCALAYVNMFGGQDELVFDGDSLVVAPDGEVIARSPQFRQDDLLVDLELPRAAMPARSGSSSLEAPDRTAVTIQRLVLSAEPLATYPPVPAAPCSPRLGEEAEVYEAVVTGLRDYVVKNGFGSVVLGLSGGIDSALCAVVACDALGADAVHGVSMPSSYSSSHSREDAQELARLTGLNFSTVPIAAMVAAFTEPLHLSGLAEENLQARVRGVTLMALSNSAGHLVLATGNKSELAVGYSTIYGDAVGGFAPLKDVSKTLVWRLARWRNAMARERGHAPPIPESSIIKPPSAELRPDQLDIDSLPDYAVLDDILDDYVEQDRSSRDIVAAGFDATLVERVLLMVDAAEYKRRQYPPGPKISARNFGRDRRLPITNRWREVAPQSGHAAPPSAPPRSAPAGEAPPVVAAGG